MWNCQWLGWYYSSRLALQRFPRIENVFSKNSDYWRDLKLTLWTQSLHSASSIHRSKARGVRTKRKCFACLMLCNKLLSNLPASSRSTSMKTLKPRNCKWTFRRLANWDPLLRRYETNTSSVLSGQSSFVGPIVLSIPERIFKILERWMEFVMPHSAISWSSLRARRESLSTPALSME